MTLAAHSRPVSATPSLVLASASRIRLALLRESGFDPACQPADLDEGAIKRQCLAAGIGPGAAALRLAAAKAGTAAGPDRLAIGADQILSCDGRWFDKPADLAAAAAQLRALSGRTHVLHTAVVLRGAGHAGWDHLAEPRLRMRALDAVAIDAYLSAEGEAVLHSVGSYLLERRGRSLFAAIEGEDSAVLGLPMSALLAELSWRGLSPRR